MKNRCAALLLTLGLFQSQQTFCADDNKLVLGAAAGVMALGAWGGYKLLGQPKKGPVATAISSDSDAKLESRIKALEENSAVSNLAERLSDLEKNSTVGKLEGALGKFELLVGDGAFEGEHEGKNLTQLLKVLLAQYALLMSRADILREKVTSLERTVSKHADALVSNDKLAQELDKQVGEIAEYLNDVVKGSEESEPVDEVSDLAAQAAGVEERIFTSF
jgi:hypothetical protein